MTLLLRLSLVGFLLGNALLAAGSLPPPVNLTANPATVRFAAAQHLALDGFELAGEGEATRPGDRLVVLFTIQDGAASRQWLGEFRAAPLTGREAKSKPGTGLGWLSLFQSSLKTDTGHEYSFEQTPAALEIRTHGPFSDNRPAAKPATTRARVLATEVYLAHGLAPMAEIELRLRSAGKKNPGLSFLFRPRFSAQQLTASQARAAEAGFTEDDERAYAAGIYTLVQFANLAFRTDGVDAITREIADSPTLFSGAFINLDWSKLESEDGLAWGLPGERVFRVPYHFRSKTKASGAFYVTIARPPLRNLAGILGLTVESTTKAPGKQLVLRVLAGRRGFPVDAAD